MGPDDVVLSYPVFRNVDQRTRAGIDALHAEGSARLEFRSTGDKVCILADGIPVCQLSVKGRTKYQDFVAKGLSPASIRYLLSLHRTPSEQDLASGWIDAREAPCWHVPLFQVVWVPSNEDGANT